MTKFLSFTPDARRIAEADSVAVIGLGRFGTSLALELMSSGTEVLGIDADEDIVQPQRRAHAGGQSGLDAARRAPTARGRRVRSCRPRDRQRHHRVDPHRVPAAPAAGTRDLGQGGR